LLPTEAEPPLNAVEREKQMAAAAQAMAEAPTREAAAEVVERVKQLGLDVLESWESTVSATNEPDPAQAARTAPEPVQGDAGQDKGADSADDRMQVEMDAAEQRKQQQREHEQAEAAEAAALDKEAAEEPTDDFVFDESGARVGAAWHTEVDVNEGALPGDEAGAAGGEEAAEALEHADEAAATHTGSRKMRRRKARTRKILSQAPGTEAEAAGTIRVETEQPCEAKMFSASNYMWLYYAVAPGTGLLRVPVGQRAEVGQCHAILDDAADVDADQIAGSHSTYCSAGISTEHPEMLYTRTYACSLQLRALSGSQLDPLRVCELP
jgi:hypothetical protein